MMVAHRFRVLLVLALLAGLGGCEVTEEKIELWKGTQQGPKKLAGTLIDPEIAMDLRAKAAVALVEINAWDLFRESFQKMEPADSAKVVNAVSPILGRMTKGEPGEEGLTKLQVDAKDGLFIMVDYAGAEGIEAVRKPLIEWATEGDYNIRAMAGQYNVKTVVKKLGAPAAEALIKLLALNQIVIEHVARLIREVNDPVVMVKASEKIAAALKADVKKIQEVHLVAAAIIGGDAAAVALLDLATDKGLSAELQRFSLRAYSQAVDQGNIKPNKEHLTRLFAMGENSEEFDPYQREETYLVIAQVGGKEDTARVAKLLENEEFFWRLVGLRCLLRMDGEGQLGPALEVKDLARSTKEANEIIDWVVKFPKLMPTVRQVLDSGGPFAKAVAVAVLAAGGNAEDKALIEKLADDGTKLPGVFEQKTLGEAAKAAIEALKEKG